MLSEFAFYTTNNLNWTAESLWMMDIYFKFKFVYFFDIAILWSHNWSKSILISQSTLPKKLRKHIFSYACRYHFIYHLWFREWILILILSEIRRKVPVTIFRHFFWAEQNVTIFLISAFWIGKLIRRIRTSDQSIKDVQIFNIIGGFVNTDLYWNFFGWIWTFV